MYIYMYMIYGELSLNISGQHTEYLRNQLPTVTPKQSVHDTTSKETFNMDMETPFKVSIEHAIYIYMYIYIYDI